MRKRLALQAMLAVLCIGISTIATSAESNTFANETSVEGKQATPIELGSIPNSVWSDWTHYHNYSEIVETILYLNATYEDLVDVFSIGNSWLNKTIYCVRLTNETNMEPKPKVLFVGYHHAREPISAEMTLYLLVNSTESFGVNETITYLLNNSEVYIVPALNVDGFDALKQNEWHRKNVHPFDEDADGFFDEDSPDDEDGDGYIENLFRYYLSSYTFIRWEGVDDDSDFLLNEDWTGGVDLNRNYGFQWNASCYSGSDNSSDDDFRGLAAFSEPETQALRDLALQHNFSYALSFHSGVELILYPWGYTLASAPHSAVFREIATDLSALVDVPNQQSSQLYTSSGNWEDWMYGNRSVFALTCEMYGNDSAWIYEAGPEPNTYWEKGVTQYFNPAPDNILQVVTKWLPAFTYLTNRAINEARNVAISEVTTRYQLVRQGKTALVNVTAANHGLFAETFDVGLYANTTIIGTQSVTLLPKEASTITFSWNTSEFAEGAYAIEAIAESVPNEVYTLDNTYEYSNMILTWIYDVTGDNYCGIDDIFETAVHFATQPDDPNWNPIYDLNDDEYVGIDDIFTLAMHFGETFP